MAKEGLAVAAAEQEGGVRLGRCAWCWPCIRWASLVVAGNHADGAVIVCPATGSPLSRTSGSIWCRVAMLNTKNGPVALPAAAEGSNSVIRGRR